MKLSVEKTLLGGPSPGWLKGGQDFSASPHHACLIPSGFELKDAIFLLFCFPEWASPA